MFWAMPFNVGNYPLYECPQLLGKMIFKEESNLWGKLSTSLSADNTLKYKTIVKQLVICYSPVVS